MRFACGVVLLPALFGCSIGRDDAVAPIELAVTSEVQSRSAIEHLVVVIQENHSFDTYFGRYCRAPVGSAPACTLGPDCCERGPDADRGGGLPVLLDDSENASYDPRHDRVCEAAEIDGGRMDGYTESRGMKGCGARGNFAYAPDETIRAYHALASEYALADRYFQPVIGASTANDLYFATAGFEFDDNGYAPLAFGRTCVSPHASKVRAITDVTIGDLLQKAGVGWRFYAEGYAQMVSSVERGACPHPDPRCDAHIDGYPCVYDPSDDPFAFSMGDADNASHMADLEAFDTALLTGDLPAVSYVKALGYRTEHPGSSISEGVSFVIGVVDAVALSPVAPKTLVLVTWDESGGFFDHVKPPDASAFDGAPYGPRVPLLAIGPFARRGTVSHETMEHSSIVKFIEWNWLGGTGLLGRRDALVNNIGSLLDVRATRVAVPER